MKCSCCGREISQNDRFCNYCGQNNEYYVDANKNNVVQPRNNEYNNPQRNALYNNQNTQVNNTQPSYTQPNYTQNNYYQAPAPAESCALSVCALIFSLLGGWLGLVLGIIGLCVNKESGNRSRCSAAIIIFVIWIIVYTFIVVAAAH